MEKVAWSWIGRLLMMNMMNIMLAMMVDRKKGEVGTDKADNDEYDGGDSVDDDP